MADPQLQEGERVCTLFEPRFLGFARYRIEVRSPSRGGSYLTVLEEQGWIWRGSAARFREFAAPVDHLAEDVPAQVEDPDA